MLDIPSESRDRFAALVKREAPEAKLNIVPSLRGTITAYGKQRVADLETLPEGAWFLRGERGVTYADTLPQGSELVAGQWWPKAYAGPPLVSLDREAARILNLRVGDTMTVSILGREIEARIASLRQVNWDTMGFNYVLVFSPNTLAAAPHSLTSTIDMDAKHEGAVSRALLTTFPSASIIAVSEVIGQVRTILDQMGAESLLGHGDMLYLPPRLAHFGIAENDCMTYSVGFRAPSAAEVLTHFTDFLGQFLTDEERYMVYEGNARRVFSRLDTALKAKGL